MEGRRLLLIVFCLILVIALALGLVAFLVPDSELGASVAGALGFGHSMVSATVQRAARSPAHGQPLVSGLDRAGHCFLQAHRRECVR